MGRDRGQGGNKVRYDHARQYVHACTVVCAQLSLCLCVPMGMHVNVLFIQISLCMRKCTCMYVLALIHLYICLHLIVCQ